MIKLHKTKTFFVGLLSVAAGVYLLYKGELPAGSQLLSTGLAAITLRHAVAKVQNGGEKKMRRKALSSADGDEWAQISYSAN